MEACGRPAACRPLGPAPPCRESIYRPAVAIPRSTAVPYVCLTAPYSRVTRAYVSFTFRGLANVAAGCCAYTRRSLTQGGRLLQEAVLGRGRGLHKSAFCCNPPFSAAPRPEGIGRLLQSTALGSAAPYTNWSLAAFGPSWQRHALQELAACCNPPFSAAPRFTEIGRLLHSAVLGGTTPYANRSFEANGNSLPWQRQSPLPITISYEFVEIHI